jgi:hypothetical protein
MMYLHTYYLQKAMELETVLDVLGCISFFLFTCFFLRISVLYIPYVCLFFSNFFMSAFFIFMYLLSFHMSSFSFLFCLRLPFCHVFSLLFFLYICLVIFFILFFLHFILHNFILTLFLVSIACLSPFLPVAFFIHVTHSVCSLSLSPSMFAFLSENKVPIAIRYAVRPCQTGGSAACGQEHLTFSARVYLRVRGTYQMDPLVFLDGLC